MAGKFEIFCAHSQFSTLTLSVETIADSFERAVATSKRTSTVADTALIVEPHSRSPATVAVLV